MGKEKNVSKTESDILYLLSVLVIFLWAITENRQFKRKGQFEGKDLDAFKIIYAYILCVCVCICISGLAKSLARRPGAIVFSSRATKMYHCLPDGLPPRGFLKTPKVSCIKLNAIKSFKYVKWYKKCNYIFKSSTVGDRKTRVTILDSTSKGNDVIE